MLGKAILVGSYKVCQAVKDRILAIINKPLLYIGSKKERKAKSKNNQPKKPTKNPPQKPPKKSHKNPEF